MRPRTLASGATVILMSMALAPLSSGEKGSTCSLDLRIEAKQDRVSLAEQTALSPADFEIRIRNTGSETITLVEPGDGSEVGWRTPIVTWQVERVGGSYETPRYGRCGNMNAPRVDEVFDLKPGEEHVLHDWLPNVRISQPGTYKIKLRYENDPAREGGYIPMSSYDPDVVQRFRNSTPCIALSNETVIEVTGVPER